MKDAKANRQAPKAVVTKLIALKMQIENMKSVYKEYDETLQLALKAGKIPNQVTYDGKTYVIAVIDAFQQKNTAWKSVAQRRFDVTISRKRSL